ncbi:MAG: Glycosyl transferase group 1 [Candidatus Peregrinibacteria bacterium GW2011_GWA2_43_8]|nr:MAG: Glycosyl transferase group 1 [Candidatus Peregrinibacteria bacterium GW2011_GWA2_43_8]
MILFLKIEKLQVALVHDFLIRLGGAERVLFELSKMYPKAPIYTLLYDEKVCGSVFPKDKVKMSCLKKLPGFMRKRCCPNSVIIRVFLFVRRRRWKNSTAVCAFSSPTSSCQA